MKLPASPPCLVGWLSIALHIGQRAGFHIGTDSVIRWSKRAEDPLPVRRWGAGRPRVVAEVDALNQWCDRQWAEANTPGSEGRHE
mgnify:CR=1 FL=1